MKLYYTLLVFLTLLTVESNAQVKFDFSGPLSGTISLEQKSPDACGLVQVEGIEDRSTMTYKVSLGYKANLKKLLSSKAVSFASGGKLFSINDLIPAPIDKPLSLALNFNSTNIIKIGYGILMELVPEVNCSYHILHCSGQVNAYTVTANNEKKSTKTMSGGVDFFDRVEIYSPSDTLIELPIEVQASLVAGQTFCNSDESKGLAGADLSASFGTYSVSIQDSVLLDLGRFLETKQINKEKIMKITVKKGTNVLDFRIKGNLYAQSVVKGLSKLNAIACGSNAGAVASHSLIVKGFTGKNGGSLPAGITIRGLVTGTDYSGNASNIDCSGLDEIKVETTAPTCGKANGSAQAIVGNINNLSFDWSNGSKGKSGFGFAEGGHFLIVRNSSGCYKSIPFQLFNISEDPTVILPQEIFLVQGDSVRIEILGPPKEDLTYQWSTRETTKSIVVRKPGVYTLTVKNTSNCFASATTRVTEKTGYWISDGNKNTDKGLFYDDGGPDRNYSFRQNRTVTFCPATQGKFLVLDFKEVDIFNCNHQDILQVYDGRTTSIPLNLNLESPARFVASSVSGGCLTVVFNANDEDLSASGWKAEISTTDAPSLDIIQEYRTCNVEFNDSGGIKGNYTNNEFKIYVFCPTDTLKKSFTRINFSQIQLATGDKLSIYNGLGTTELIAPDVRSPATYSASANSNGCLTAVFTSDGQETAAGWVSQVTCITTPTASIVMYSDNPPPTNTCDVAPLIDNYGIYRGTTSSKYSSTYSGNLRRDFCGVIDNNAFYRFISDGTPFQIDYNLSGGLLSQCQGVQISVLKANGNCNEPTTSWEFLTCQTIEGAALHHIEISNMTAGQEYFIMVDGAYGSTCTYTLTPKSGIKGLKIVAGEKSTICNGDGTYFVEFTLTGPVDNRTYLVQEQNNYFGEFKEFNFVNNQANQKIKYGPYPVGRSYHIVVKDALTPEFGKVEFSGASPCPPSPCKAEAKVSTVCYASSENATVIIELPRAALPISIVGSGYNNVVLPNGPPTNRVTFSISKKLLETDLPVVITDAGYCSTQAVLKTPNCMDCPEDFVLYPNPTTGIISIAYPCQGFEISVYNMSGHLQFESDVLTQGEEKLVSLDVSTFQPGLYLLRLKKGNISMAKSFLKH